jgi:hypothetical protein
LFRLIESSPRLAPMFPDLRDLERAEARGAQPSARSCATCRSRRPNVICPRGPIALWMMGGRPMTRSSSTIAM